jgi:dihydrofolate synthase/folylpolyglutamate synthase
MNSSFAFNYLESLKKYGIILELDRIKTVLNEFDNPQDKFPSILIGGTNGKGSVCAIIAEALRNHNFKTGLYTSPHLINLEERIRINNKYIPSPRLEKLITVVYQKVNNLLYMRKISNPLTYFEILTICAFLYFAQENIDIAVLEVGLGGRLDATNVVKPLLTVITNVSKDHQNFLGNTLRKIAQEKAGIIKQKTPIICGCKGDISHQIIKNKAKEKNAPFLEVFNNLKNFKIKKKNLHYEVELEVNKNFYCFKPSLLGLHQVENSIIAVHALEMLSKIWKPLNKKKIIKAVENVSWPGRLEIINENLKIILDGAHNVEGIKAIKSFLEENNLLPYILIFAIMKDKEIEKITRLIFPPAKRIILTTFPYYRAADPEYIYEKSLLYKKKILIERSPSNALKKARELAGQDDIILVTGSLFLIGEIKKSLNFKST